MPGRSSLLGHSAAGDFDQGGACLSMAKANVASLEVEVRWMVTGALACVVSLMNGEGLSLEELRWRIKRLIAVPPSEQFLFPASGGPELCDEHAVIAKGRGCSAEDECTTSVEPRARGAIASQRCDSEPAVTALLLLRSLRDPRITDLSSLHSEVKFEVVPPGEFTALRRLGRGRGGDLWLHRLGPGVGIPGGSNFRGQLALARLLRAEAVEPDGRATSERVLHMRRASDSRLEWQPASDHRDTLTEIGVLAYLAKQEDLPLYLLRMIGTLCMDQQNLLVTEFADGGRLLDAVALSSDAMAPRKKRRYMWQILQALKYLHQHRIGHRDVSLTNIFLKDGSIRLANFGACVQSHTESGVALRYYSAVGREPYCAPECHIPSSARACVFPPSGSSAGDIVLARVEDNYLCEVRLPEGAQPNVQCNADLWGYAAAPADIFAAGVCLYIMGMQTPPWRIAAFSDPCFSHMYRKGDMELLDTLRDWVPDGRLEHGDLDLMSQMLLSQPRARPCAGQCLESRWFADMAQTPVGTHAQSLTRAAAGGC